jgi:coatomer protein complex subunit alpha (xenin)
MFHARQDIIVSNSEDKSIRVWDMSKRTGVQTFRREHDRFWVLAAHPEMNLLAAGHDSGMIVFKLERERPAYTVYGGTLYSIKERHLRSNDLASGKEVSLISIRRAGTTGMNQAPRSMCYNPAENAVLICSDVDGGSYELYVIPKDISGRDTQEPKRGLGGSAVFVARNRFACIDKAVNQIVLKNLKNEVTKKCPLPLPSTDALFYAGTGNLLCRSEDQIVLFDVQQRTILGEIQTPSIKYVVWSTDMENVALISKHAIVIASKKLDHKCTLHETIRVKSGAWDEINVGVFIYATLNHIKYCLPNGDNGIIRTLDVPVYIVKVSGTTLHCLDRDGKIRTLQIDATEYMFKLALIKKRYDEVIQMIKNSQLCGEAIIAYLQQKGYPDIALHFVKDERTRFNLAIESGNIAVALISAKEIDEKDYWYKLGVEALRQGNHEIVEYSYQKTKNFERLSFLYLITGNMEKLNKMLKIAEMRNDVMGRYHNSLYLGDIHERIKILEESGQLALAYVTASVHGLTDVASRLEQDLGENVPSLPEKSELLLPPPPVLLDGNWPLLLVSKGLFEGAFADSAVMEEEDADATHAWGEEVEILDMDGNNVNDAVIVEGDEVQGGGGDEEGGWEMEDLELPADVGATANVSTITSGLFVTPSVGVPVSQVWTQKSSLAGEHVAAGAFDTAMRLLNRQLGIKNFAPLKSLFLDVYLASHAYIPSFLSIPAVPLALEKGWNESTAPNVRNPPALIYTLPLLEEKLKLGYKVTTEGKFTEALKIFLGILHMIPLVVVDNRKEVDEVKELVGICKEYVLAIRIELKRKATTDDIVRQQELAAYFTHCNLQSVHLKLSLHSAMVLAYKGKNFLTAATFCRRLLELNPSQQIAAKARQVLAACEKNPRDETPLNYDSRNPFTICGSTFTPIYKGSNYVTCPYTGAHFVPEVAGSISPICELAVVGADASGLLCLAGQVR